MARRSLLLLVLLGLAAAAPAAEPAAPAPLARDEFVSALAGQLVQHFNLEGELQLELLRPWTPPASAAQQWSLDVLEYPAVPGSAMLVRCRLLGDGQPAGECSIMVRAACWRDAWVARQPLAVGEIFTPARLDTRRVDIFREREALPVTVGDNGYVLAHAVAPGRLLTWRDVARRPLVRKGELVEVAAVEGALQITMQGLALENGAAGDTVTVRNPESRKDFPAQVVAEHRVQIRF